MKNGSPDGALQRLVEDLVAEFRRDERGRRAAQLLADYAAGQQCWKRYVHFQPDCYTRNLVARNEHFEMLVLCWSAGQESPIHDHAGQRCWMGILDGVIEETQFELPEGGGALVELGTRSFPRGKVAYIDDDIALHRVRPAPGGGGGVSLHLYSKPIDVCRIFDRQSGRVIEKTMLYHSVDGVPAVR